MGLFKRSTKEKPHAYIQQVVRGNNKGQFRFTLKGSNGETVAVSHPETYTRKEKCIQTLKELFPNFEIVDKTK